MQSMSASKLNVKQLREKYEQIKQNNRAYSARLSQASSRDRQTHGSQKHYDNVQRSQELLCSPCYNKKIFEQQEQMKKQQQQLEKNLYRSQLELNMKQEHTKMTLFEMEQKRKKEIELQNLNLSKQYHLLKQEQQKKLKADELEFEKTINKKNYELELKEKYEKTQKKVSFGQELKVQIEEKKRLTQQDFRENNGIIDDPYWRHQSQGEKEVQQRKNFQQSYVNNNWINFEKERLKQKGQIESIKKQEQEDRMKNLKEYHIQLQTEKQKKMLLQKELVNDISEQIKRKRERESQERILNQQLQRQRDEQDLNKQRQRELREIDNKKNINQQMIEGLQHQLSYKKSTAKKEKEDSYNNTLLLSSVMKQQIPCSNCKRCQDRQLLSVL